MTSLPLGAKDKVVIDDGRNINNLVIVEKPTVKQSEGITISSKNLSHSSHLANSKRSFLDIVDNPMKEGPKPKQMKESPLSINALLQEQGQSVPPRRLSMGDLASSFPLSSGYHSSVQTKSFPFTIISSHTNNSSPLPPMNPMRMNTSNGPSKANKFGRGNPDNDYYNPQLPPNLPPSPHQTLPGVNALFGINLNTIGSPQMSRFAAVPPSKPIEKKTAPQPPPLFPMELYGDSYHYINKNSPPRNQFPAFLPPQDSGTQSINNRVHIDHSLQLSSPVIRFPLSDRVNSLTSGLDQNRFILLEQPNEIQRKSYKNESRYYSCPISFYFYTF